MRVSLHTRISADILARLILCTLFLHVLDTVQVYGVTDVSAHFGGKAGAEYTETTDSQSKALEGTEDSLSIRNLDTFSFVDLGLNLGTLKLSDDTGTHDVDFQANYANVTAGASFTLYPSWIEYYFDLGYRVGIGRLEVLRTESDGSKDQYTYNNYVNGAIFKTGVKLVILGKFIVGAHHEFKNVMFEKRNADLNTTVDAAGSFTLSLGYRFGGKSGTASSKVESGKSNYNDPCLLFRGAACN